MSEPRRSGERAHATRREVLALGAGLAAGGALLGCQAARATARSSVAPTVERRAQLDELFADLADQSGSVQPIQPQEYAARRAHLGRLLSERGTDAFLCESGATMTYLAGVGWGRSERLFALIVLADGSHFWLSPAFEAEKARLRIEGEKKPGGEIVRWEEHEYPWTPLASALRARGAQRLGLDPSTRLFVADRMSGALGAERVHCASELVAALRSRKDAHEIELLRTASVLTQRAIAACAPHVRPGMNGGDVTELLQHALQKLGLVNPWVLALVGPAAAYPHGENHAVELHDGEFLLVDTGGTLHDYQSDTSRTWAPAGRPSAEQLRVWNAVRDAQLRAFETIRPGVRCGDVDRAARASLDAAGFGPGYRTFTHRLGHGIGVEGHEDPYFDGGSEVLLEEGMTLSDEPGVYLLGELGVRLEDVVCVTADGAEHFGSWAAGPSSPA